MAANEHKNLTDINRHNPMGFENATNDTLLSKDSGTSATGTDGNLVWLPKSSIKTTVVPIKGYTTSNGSTYEYAQQMTDAQSPFEHNVDYGSGTVGDATLDVSDIFRAGGYVSHSNCTINKISGWLVGNAATVATLAICKITPVNNDATPLTPILLDEIEITCTTNDKLQSISEITFSNDSLLEGDIVFAMIKADVTGRVIFFNVTMELSYDN